MWQILNVEPTYGVCSICRSHECGMVDGKHQWIHCEALDDSGENIVIGYKCVKLFAQNLGISKEVVEKMVFVPPSDYEILQAIKNSLGELDYEHLLTPTFIVPDGVGLPPNQQKAKTHPRSTKPKAK